MDSAPVELAERVAIAASDLGVPTVVIGAYALAAYEYVRGTADIDLAMTAGFGELRRVDDVLRARGLSTELYFPEPGDSLGGMLRIWEHADDEGDPIDPVDLINFHNHHSPRVNPAHAAIENATAVEGKPALRFPALADLIALKLYAGARRDLSDVVEVLKHNPDADIDRIRETCMRYGLDKIDELIAEAHQAVGGITRR